MIRIILICIIFIISSEGLAAPQNETVNAAIELKKAHVMRSFETCMIRTQNENRCRQLLQLLHKREVENLNRLKPALTDTDVNQVQFNKEMNACYSPSNDYGDLINCRELLAERYEDAKQGKFILKVK